MGPSGSEHDVTLWGAGSGTVDFSPYSPGIVPATPFLIGSSAYEAEAYSRSHCRVDVSDIDYARLSGIDVDVSPDMRFADVRTEILGRLAHLGVEAAAYDGMVLFADAVDERACPGKTLAEQGLNPASLFRLGHGWPCTGVP